MKELFHRLQDARKAPEIARVFGVSVSYVRAALALTRKTQMMTPAQKEAAEQAFFEAHAEEYNKVYDLLHPEGDEAC
jgi:hypothetical protein